MPGGAGGNRTEEPVQYENFEQACQQKRKLTDRLRKAKLEMNGLKGEIEDAQKEVSRIDDQLNVWRTNSARERTSTPKKMTIEQFKEILAFGSAYVKCKDGWFISERGDHRVQFPGTHEVARAQAGIKDKANPPNISWTSSHVVRQHMLDGNDPQQVFWRMIGTACREARDINEERQSPAVRYALEKMAEWNKMKIE